MVLRALMALMAMAHILLVLGKKQRLHYSFNRCPLKLKMMLMVAKYLDMNLGMLNLHVLF